MGWENLLLGFQVALQPSNLALAVLGIVEDRKPDGRTEITLAEPPQIAFELDGQPFTALNGGPVPV